MSQLKLFIDLTRLKKPIGYMLLFWPCVWGLTLFDVNSAAEKCKDKIGDKWEGFANYWRTTQLEYTWLRSLMKRHKDFWQITEDSLDKSMKAYEIDSSMRNELLDLYKILSPFM